MWWLRCTFLNFSFEATNKVDDEALIKASDDQWALFVRVTRSESRLFFIRNNCLPLPQGCWCLISTRSLQSRKEGLILSTFLVGINIGEPVMGRYQLSLRTLKLSKNMSKILLKNLSIFPPKVCPKNLPKKLFNKSVNFACDTFFILIRIMDFQENLYFTLTMGWTSARTFPFSLPELFRKSDVRKIKGEGQLKPPIGPPPCLSTKRSPSWRQSTQF